jgi:type I restriction enzyme, S subunit
VTVRLPVKRLASVMLGKMVQPESKNSSDGLAPYLRAAHVQSQGRIVDLPEQPMWFSPAELRVLNLRRGDVVIVEGGAGYGRSAVVRDDLRGWGFQNSIIRLRPFSERADGRFLDYAIQDALSAGRVDVVTSTATIPHFTADKVAKFEIGAPPLDEQRAIADFLDRETGQIDEMTVKQDEFICLLRERRITQISRAVERGPSNVRLRRHVNRIRQGWSPNCEPYPADGVTEWGVLKVGCSLGGIFRANENKCLPTEVQPRPEYVVNRGEIVMSRSNTSELVGNAALVKEDFPRLMLSDLNYGLTVAATLDPEFAVYALMAKRARAELISSAKGTSSSMQKLAQRDVLEIPLWVPSIDEQRAIVAQLDRDNARLDALITKAQEHIAFAQERRAALVTAAVTGQFDVPVARKAG